VPLHELRWEWSYPDILQAIAILEYDETWELAMEGARPEDPK